MVMMCGNEKDTDDCSNIQDGAPPSVPQVRDHEFADQGVLQLTFVTSQQDGGDLEGLRAAIGHLTTTCVQGFVCVCVCYTEH